MPYCFPSQLYHFIFPPALNSLSCSTSLKHLFSTFWIISILMGMKWYLIVLLLCISLMTGDVGYLFMWLLALCLSCLDKCSLKSFAYFLNWFALFFLLSSFRGFSLHLYINSLSDMICKYFLPFHGFSFHPLGSLLLYTSF